MMRRISLVIALAISFLMMFGSIARVEAIQVPTSAPTSEPTELETVKAPPQATNPADNPPLQTKASDKLQERKQNKKKEEEISTRCVGDCVIEGAIGTKMRLLNGSYDCSPC
jgi:hypothetical protein